MAERLHLDLIRGARAEMIAGALVAVGASTVAAQEALARVGLGRIDLVTEHVSRCGLAAVRCRLLIEGLAWGDELAGPSLGASAGRPRGPRRRHPLPKPRLEGAARASPLVTAATVAGVQGDHGLVGVVDDRSRARRKDDVKKPRVPRNAPSEPARWLDGTDPRAADLVDVVRAAPLPPIVKALALKSARRLVDALAAVTSSTSPRLRGPWAARILADLVVGAALVEALSPASITASPVGVSSVAGDDEGVRLATAGEGALAWPTPSPWLLEVLAGVPVVEGDDPLPLCDVAGAALAWSIVHRFGARGVTSTTKHGCGASGLEAAGHAVVARALLGPAPTVATRAGTKEIIAAVVVEARLPTADPGTLGGLRGALVAAGAVDVEAAAVDVLGTSPALLAGAGTRALRLRVLVPGAAVDAVTSALWHAGAVDVAATWVERRHAGVEEVTVAIGRGRHKSSVRVRVVRDGSEILRVEPDADDVREAAARASASVHVVAADAIAAWQRLHSSRPGARRPTLPSVR